MKLTEKIVEITVKYAAELVNPDWMFDDEISLVIREDYHYIKVGELFLGANNQYYIRKNSQVTINKPVFFCVSEKVGQLYEKLIEVVKAE